MAIRHVITKGVSGQTGTIPFLVTKGFGPYTTTTTTTDATKASFALAAMSRLRIVVAKHRPRVVAPE